MPALDSDTTALDHAAYRAAYGRGEIRVDIEPQLAYRYLSARMLLPLVMLALLGVGVALAMAVHWFPGVLVIIAGFVLPRLTRMSAAGFLMARSLDDATVYADLVRLGILRVVRL